MKLLVKEYLETKTFGDLVREHGVYASFSKSGYKWSLNYDQLESKESDPLAQQCRGLILATSDCRSLNPEATIVDGKMKFDHICPGKTNILAYPMNRFFNHGQGAAANIDWNDPNISILEKLDGTLIIVYFDPISYKWCVATRSVPEADILLDSGFYTFRTLFEKAVTSLGMTFDEFVYNLGINCTYCFELTSPFNRIVVDYKDTNITLIAARNSITLNELNLNTIKTPAKTVQSYKFTSISDLLNWVSTQNPLEHEGVVVLDSNFNRIKVKNAAYVAFNRARDILGTSERNCLELVLAGKEDDVIPALPPEIVDRIVNIKAGVIKMIDRYDTAYFMIKSAADMINSDDKKTFAKLVMKMSESKLELWSAPMFNMFDKKSSNMKDFIEKNRKDGTWSDSFLDKILNIIKK